MSPLTQRPIRRFPARRLWRPTVLAMFLTASKSPREEETGNPPSITSTPSRDELLGDLQLLRGPEAAAWGLFAVS